MRTIKLGKLEVPRLILGTNQVAGFSHQGPERDREMVRYFTAENIMAMYRKAEAAGVTHVIARSDRHVTRVLMEYWDKGGAIRWIAQTATELGDQIKAVRDAAAVGAKAVYIHGGQVDYWFAQKQYDMLKEALKVMRECGVAAGFAGHSVDAHAWIRDNLDPDFQMCCYYDPTPRADSPHHVSTPDEKWDDKHRDAMVKLIQTIPRPVIHYKVFAGGNRPIPAGFESLKKNMRKDDLVCIGHYLGDNPDMIAENVRTFETVVEGA